MSVLASFSSFRHLVPGSQRTPVTATHRAPDQCRTIGSSGDGMLGPLGWGFWKRRTEVDGALKALTTQTNSAPPKSGWDFWKHPIHHHQLNETRSLLGGSWRVVGSASSARAHAVPVPCQHAQPLAVCCSTCASATPVQRPVR